MALPVHIRSGKNGHLAYVTPEQALKVVNCPPQAINLTNNELTNRKALFELFTDDLGSSAMNVNASLAAPRTFYIRSQSFKFPGISSFIEYKYQFVTNIRLFMRSVTLDPSTGSDMRRFGPVAGGLTNGILMSVTQANIKTDIFLWPAKLLADMFEQVTSYMSFPSVTSTPTTDMLILNIAFQEPIVIPAHSLDRIDIVIQDNLSGIAEMHAQVTGFYELHLP